MNRRAVVLLNLGGPDSLDAVRPFLFNLFNDPAIIGLPQPLRWLLAKLISGRRTAEARHIYSQIGGRSPLLPETEAQARDLEQALGDDWKVFVAMRYWHPMSPQTAAAVEAFEPDEIVLLPLYPQFSTSTTASSFAAWDRAAQQVGLDVPTARVGCYPIEPGLIAAHAKLIGNAIKATRGREYRILFSAHGLPKKVIAGGDPYQWQVEQTVAAVMAALSGDQPEASFDHAICYQSRVGPLEWIGPSTDAEIERAGRDGVAVVLVPIAFVSEHSETLVELDITYRNLAERVGVPAYIRVGALGGTPAFIDGLADLARAAVAGPPRSATGRRLCPAAFGRCACQADG